MSSYCINPFCPHRENPENTEKCLSCGTSLLINNRIRLVEPLRPLTDDPFSYFDVFEVEDSGISLYPVPKQRIMKVLKWNSSKLVQLIERESLILQLVLHPSIPRSSLSDFFTFIPNNSLLTLHCLLMDKFEGQSLDQWIKSNGAISQLLALKWLKQLIEILDVVHHTEFFHRDIKPSNIIIQPSGQLALVDFGAARRLTNTYMAKVSASGGTNTRVGKYEITTVVTPRYTPPEQIDGEAVPQSDFFALGRTFVYLSTGVPLIDLPKHKQTGRLIWRNKAPQIDKPFADFLDDLMAPLPGQRPQSTKIILQRLQNLPLKNKIYKLIRSKIFIISTTIVSIILGSLGISKIILPTITYNLVIQGKKLEGANDSHTAQHLFDSAIKISPKMRFTISKFYFEKGLNSTISLESAKKYYELAIKYNDKDIQSYNNLGIVCRQLSDSKCVINAYKKSFAISFDNWEGHYGLGIFYDENMKYDLAEQQYKIAIKASSHAILAINNLSRLKILKGDYKTAISLAQEGLKKAKIPGLRATLYKNIGWAKFEQKKYGEAKYYLEKAKELDIQRTSTHCLLAQVQEILGDFENSWVSWEACLLTQSRDPEVFTWRLEVLERIKKKPFHPGQMHPNYP
ncbi:MAG: protein kinase [Nostoc indistinguendum CM1-VF10]|jgi:serine/threonine protein kinase|nr:protein kinase [Nostoc indistinguendum CM1-VF10]